MLLLLLLFFFVVVVIRLFIGPFRDGGEPMALKRWGSTNYSCKSRDVMPWIPIESANICIDGGDWKVEVGGVKKRGIKQEPIELDSDELRDEPIDGAHEYLSANIITKTLKKINPKLIECQIPWRKFPLSSPIPPPPPCDVTLPPPHRRMGKREASGSFENLGPQMSLTSALT